MRSSARRMTTVEWMDTTVKPPGEANNQTVSEATALSHTPSHPSKKPSGLVLNLYPDSAVLGLDLESFRWQETTFAMLNLALLAALLCAHALFSRALWGSHPSPGRIAEYGLPAAIGRADLDTNSHRAADGQRVADPDRDFDRLGCGPGGDSGITDRSRGQPVLRAHAGSASAGIVQAFGG